ncbi:MAG: hypothetical protein Q8Q24_00630, partial [bacterium]|nr:hypothetical protein [bacterium]
NKNGSFKITTDVTGKNIGPWNSTTDPILAKMDPGQSWQTTYTIKLDKPEYIDSTFTNVVNVTSAEGESAFTNRSFIIGASMAGSCPLKGGGPITCGSYISPTQGCHGTNQYWAGNPPACSYPLGGFLGPNDPNSVCYSKCRAANNCGPGYGFAVDVGGSTGQAVVFPSINGENITWNSSWAGPCGLDGCGTNYKGADSKGNTYWLYVTHMQSQGVVIGPPRQSGDIIGYLKDLSGRGGTHLHYELAINGVTVRPEFLCQ